MNPKQHQESFGFPFSIWPLLATVFFGVLFTTLGVVRYTPPEIPRSELEGAADNPNFSLARVFAIWETLVGDEIPHPAGSVQLEVVRKRIIDFAESHGMQVQLHTTMGQSRLDDTEISLVNLLIYLPGTDPHGTIALTTHYDSSPMGPGAADDGAAVAASLELARYYHKHPPKNNLLFLITDGEELGLLGAKGFVREHPLATEIDLVINLEARGTSGPSCMFETADASLWSIRHFAAIAERPITSSLFYEVYRILPNNTDFTRYKELPIQGWNFAFIGDVKNYHTPKDKISLVDKRSVRHQIQHARGLLSRLVDAEDFEISNQRAVYFDYLGLVVVYFDQARLLPVVGIASLVFGAGVVFALKRQQVTFRGLVCVVGGLLLVSIGLLLVLLVTFESMRWQDYFSPPWPTNPLPIWVAFWFVAVGVTILGCWMVREFQREVFVVIGGIGFGLLWMMVGWAPGASYLGLIPCLVAASIVWLLPSRSFLAATLWWVAFAGVWFPLETLFYDALGFRFREVLVGRMWVMTIAATPILVYCWKQTVANDKSV